MSNKKKWSLTLTTILILLGMALLIAACGSSAGSSSAAEEGQTRANTPIVSPICQGTPLPEAPAYDQTSGIHPMIALELGDDGNYEYGFFSGTTYKQPVGWRASYVETMQLVVCVDTETDELVETCEYTMADGSGTAVLKRYAKQVTFRLVEAQTGREIAADTLTGLPRECQETEKFLENTTGSSMYGDVYEEMEAWLRPYVEIP
ncbi:MAG: hypothetical protein P8183_00205 [Anaerolineae bacterium]